MKSTLGSIQMPKFLFFSYQPTFLIVMPSQEMKKLEAVKPNTIRSIKIQDYNPFQSFQVGSIFNLTHSASSSQLRTSHFLNLFHSISSNRGIRCGSLVLPLFEPQTALGRYAHRLFFGRTCIVEKEGEAPKPETYTRFSILTFHYFDLCRL